MVVDMQELLYFVKLKENVMKLFYIQNYQLKHNHYMVIYHNNKEL